jgi:Arc/MetJ-type ribon-helix-helix transcriptional regulator
MKITLSPADQELVEQRLRSGEYRSASELMSRAPQVLVAREEEIERDRDEIRAHLDWRYEQTMDPATEWLDGEQVMEEMLARIEEFERNAANPAAAAVRPEDSG